jgi:protein gp37
MTTLPEAGTTGLREPTNLPKDTMSTATKIEWTDTTWNPVTGCDRISDGCDNCYALALAKRLKAMGSPKYQVDGDPRTSGPGFGVTVHDSAMLEPLSWRVPRRVFVNSMSDLGHAGVGRLATARIWAVMALTARHQFQVLTKRPKRLATLLGDPTFVREVAQHATDIISHTPPHLGRWRLDLGGQRLAGDSSHGGGWSIETNHDTDSAIGDTLWLPPWPLPNVWVGVSVETQKYADTRIPALLRTPAAVRFLSCEPLLNEVDISEYLDGECGECMSTGEIGNDDLACSGCAGERQRPRLDWVIAGGESGSPQARPMDPEWVRSLRDQCQAANVAFFFKQWGHWAPAGWGLDMARHHIGREVLIGQPVDDMGHRQVMRRLGKNRAGRELDGRTWDEYPTNDRLAEAVTA